MIFPLLSHAKEEMPMADKNTALKRKDSYIPDGILMTGKTVRRQPLYLVVALLACLAFLFLGLSKIPFIQVSLRYIYLVFIFLAGFGYGLTGGLIMALICSVLFSAPHFSPDAPGIKLLGALVDITAFFTTGFITGFRTEKQSGLKTKLKEMAFYDELTGCINYRLIIELLNRQISLAQRTGEEISVVMLDIDRFKEINDSFGHVNGNRFLKWFAEMVRNSMRAVDYVGRYGGDEFLVILPECGKEQALRILKRLKRNIMGAERVPEDLRQETCSSMRFSAGIASFPVNGHTARELIQATDSSLYQAKNSGRDRVVLEKRGRARLKTPPSLTMELIGYPGVPEDLRLQLMNISKSGMAFSVPGNISHNDFICRMKLPGTENPMELKCRIVHKDLETENQYRFGVHFLNTPAEFEETLERLAENSSPA